MAKYPYRLPDHLLHSVWFDSEAPHRTAYDDTEAVRILICSDAVHSRAR
jgi:hypothetical protein